MKRRNQFALAIALVCALILVLTGFSFAQGRRDRLNGTYSFTGEQACLVSPAGFNANLTPAGANTSAQSASTFGIIKFNPDGTGTAEFRELLIVYPPAALLAASAQQASFSFTYTIDAQGVLNFTINTVTGSFVAGPYTGLTFSNNPPPMVGRVASNGSTITLATVDPAVETTTIGAPLNVSMPRVCHRSRILIPIHENSID